MSDSPIDQATSVRPGETLNIASLTAYLRTHVPELASAETVSVEQFPSGHSNLTYLLRVDDPVELLAMPFGLTTLPGNFSRRELAQRYAERSGRDLGGGVFYYIYGLLKIAVIAQQIYARYKAGLTQDRRFATLIYGVQTLGEQACRAIDKGRIDDLGRT